MKRNFIYDALLWLLQRRVAILLGIILTVVLTAVHVVMYRKFAGTPEEPTPTFTLVVHTGLAVAIIAAIVVYNHCIKKKLKAYETKCNHNK